MPWCKERTCRTEIEVEKLIAEPPLRAGPLLMYVDTEPNKYIWRGSVLFLVRSNTRTPALKVECLSHIDSQISTEGQHLCDVGPYCVYKWIITVAQSTTTMNMLYTIMHGEWQVEHLFLVAGRCESWKFAMFSCNGLSHTSGYEGYAEKYYGICGMWADLVRQHHASKFHCMLGLGDQIYMDCVWEHTKSLDKWTRIPARSKRESMSPPPGMYEEVDRWILFFYIQHFGEAHFRDALAKIPYMMQGGDHDFVDGFGSYPEALENCEVMQLYRSIVTKYYLLFQMHVANANATTSAACESKAPPENFDQKVEHKQTSCCSSSSSSVGSHDSSTASSSSSCPSSSSYVNQHTSSSSCANPRAGESDGTFAIHVTAATPRAHSSDSSFPQDSSPLLSEPHRFSSALPDPIPPNSASPYLSESRPPNSDYTVNRVSEYRPVSGPQSASTDPHAPADQHTSACQHTSSEHMPQPSVAHALPTSSYIRAAAPVSADSMPLASSILESASLDDSSPLLSAVPPPGNSLLGAPPTADFSSSGTPYSKLYLGVAGGHHYVKNLGDRVRVLGLDTRLERNRKVVVAPGSYDRIFEELDRNFALSIKKPVHLLVVAEIPLIASNLQFMEKIFDGLSKFRRGKCVSALSRPFTIFKSIGFPFSEPVLMTDMIDRWNSTYHMEERNQFLKRIQKWCEKTHVRVTFVSGDVHMAGLGKFATPDDSDDSKRRHYKNRMLTPFDAEKDHKLMFQITTSAIGNVPPPPWLVQLYHMIDKTSYINDPENGQTMARNLPLFKRNTGGNLLGGKKSKKFMGLRNWCAGEFFEEDRSLFFELYVELFLGAGQCMKYDIRVPALAMWLNSVE